MLLIIIKKSGQPFLARSVITNGRENFASLNTDNTRFRAFSLYGTFDDYPLKERYLQLLYLRGSFKKA